MSRAIATLYLEELKATMRGRFAWLGGAVVFVHGVRVLDHPDETTRRAATPDTTEVHR